MSQNPTFMVLIAALYLSEMTQAINVQKQCKEIVKKLLCFRDFALIFKSQYLEIYMLLHTNN